MADVKDFVIITGTDSGMGKSLAELFLKNGHRVFATYLESPGTEKSVNFRLDLRKDDDIRNFGNRIVDLESTGLHCSCIIHNAGVALGGPIENLPVQLYRESLDVNLLGIIKITQRLLPLFIKNKSTIILHGSAAGRVAAPFLSPYVVTKFALSGFADCLRRELQPYGIRTILLETGGVDTPLWQKAEKQDTSFIAEKYLKSMELFRKNFIQGDKGITAQQAAEKIYRIFRAKKPKPRYIIAKSNLRERIIRMIPARFMDDIFKKMFGMDYGG